MPTSRMPFEPVTMDVHRKAIPGPHFGVNGGHNGAGRNSHDRPRKDETLQFLSQEEQECIQFFEETIDSLVDEDVEGEARQKQAQLSRSTTQPVDECDGPRPHTMASSIARSLSTKDRPNSSKDQDIIDLVHSSPPDLVQPIQKPFNTPLPDFTKNMDNPESHYENKPRREAMEHYPSEYNMHTFREDSAPYGHAQYQPVGSVPTPVLIAQKIAKNQAGGGNTNILPSSRTSISRRSLESERPPSSPDHSNKQGPPTSAKPIHYPSNINIMMGSNQHHSQAMAGVNLHDRKSQMLANLSGMSHPLVEEPLHGLQSVQPKLPSRSVSFRDPTPDKSRMEALSKLGLTRNRSPSGGPSTLVPPESVTNPTASSPPAPGSAPVRAPTTTPLSKLDMVRQAKPSPLATVTTNSAIHARSHDNNPAASPPPEVSSKDFNSYGGKTIMVNPSKSTAVPASPAPTDCLESKAQPIASSSDFNPYGGKSKVMASVPTTRTDPQPPDVQSRAMPSPACSPVRVMPPPVFTSMPNKVEPMPYENNSYGRKTKEVTPSHVPPSPAVTPDIVAHTLVRSPSRAQAPAPSPAPRPFRYSTPNPNRVAASPSTPPENQRKSISKPSFRSQGITVQFSGRGATDESRREALRKLGLLKDTL
ncbi:proline and serine-rich protein 2 [Esox lucius]|uniref:proline and serine-rich protein 2 n=1 Tax=Esox lucius TaxID=8010 RepID=UPI0014772289|nr:proline and serine-rich protein 2 [Esox lucius]